MVKQDKDPTGLAVHLTRWPGESRAALSLRTAALKRLLGRGFKELFGKPCGLVLRATIGYPGFPFPKCMKNGVGEGQPTSVSVLVSLAVCPHIGAFVSLSADMSNCGGGGGGDVYSPIHMYAGWCLRCLAAPGSRLRSSHPHHLILLG